MKKRIELPIATVFLVESFAEKHGMSPSDAAYFLASMGRTTKGGKSGVDACIFSHKEVVRPDESES